ncbi:hypothetical protein Tco_0508544 [Tanacetum coccineum]
MKESHPKEIKMTKAKENDLNVEIQIISSENAQNYQETIIKEPSLEDHGVIATKMKKKRPWTKNVLWLKHPMSCTSRSYYQSVSKQTTDTLVRLPMDIRLKIDLENQSVHINWYQEPALPFEVPTLRVVAYRVVAWTQRWVLAVTNIAVTNELGVVAYGVVAWTQRGVPAVTNEDVGSLKGGVLL